MAFNWEKAQAEYYRTPDFAGYSAYVETRRIVLDCSLGVNPLGNIFDVSSMSVDIGECYQYPHSLDILVSHICSRWKNISGDELLFGTGSQGILLSLSRVLGGSKVKILGLSPQYMPGLMEFITAGSTVNTVSLPPYTFEINIDALIDAIEDDTSAVYLDNPHNPTGAVLPLKDVRRLALVCAERGVLLVADEAYGDFFRDDESAMNLDLDNVICIRSFSKGYGMAGLRIGYAVFRDPMLRAQNRVEMLYSVSEPSILLAGKLLPRIDIFRVRDRCRVLKKKFMDFVSQYSDFCVAPTHESTPIVLITWKNGEDLYDKLMEAGIRTEAGHFFGIKGKNSVRMRIPMEENFEEFCGLWRLLFG